MTEPSKGEVARNEDMRLLVSEWRSGSWGITLQPIDPEQDGITYDLDEATLDRLFTALRGAQARSQGCIEGCQMHIFSKSILHAVGCPRGNLDIKAECTAHEPGTHDTYGCNFQGASK